MTTAASLPAPEFLARCWITGRARAHWWGMTPVVTEVVPAASSPSHGRRTRPPSSAVAGAGWLAVGAVASKASQTLVLLVFAAVLEPDAFGVISLGAVLLNVTTVLADMGTSTALVHLRGDAERAARTAVTIALSTSLGLVAVVWLSTPWLARNLQLGGEGSDVLRGIVLCVPLAAVAGVSAELLRRALDFRRRVVPDVVGNAVGAAVTIGALAGDQGVLALVYGQLAQAFVVLLLFWSVRRPVRPGWSTGDASALVSYGASLAGGSLLTLLILNVDYLLIANRLGVSEVGVYSLAFRVAYMPYLLIAMVIGGAVFAHLCRMRGRTVGRATFDAAVVLQALVVPAYVGVLVFAPHLRLLGEEWAPAVPVLRWLAAYGLVLSALELLSVSLKSVGRTSDLLGLTALHLGVLLVLLVLVVDRGVTAVAVAQVAAGVVTLVAAALVVDRRVPGTEWTVLARRLLPVAAGGIVLAGTGMALQRMLPEVSFVALAVAAPVSLLAYLATVLVLDPDDRTGLARIRRVAQGRAPGAVGLYGVLGVAGVAAGSLAVVAPYAVLVTLVAVVLVAVLVSRVEWAALAYVAAEPFGDLLREVHPGAIKALGGILFVAWLVRLLQDARPAGLRHPGVVALGALVVVLLASFVAQGAPLETGLDHSVGYVSYALVVVVLVDTLRRGRPDPEAFARRLVTVFVLSCTAAGAVAVVGFLAEGGRAAGPLADPNDLAFFMVAALPFALVAARRSTASAWLFGACGAVLVVAVLATFSRGAVVGLAAMVVAAVLFGAVRMRTLLAVAAATAVVAGALWWTHGDVIESGLAEKRHVAAANVDLRVTTATMAAEMTADSPLLGQGPGGFEVAREQFVPASSTEVEQTVAHQMYLDVSAELGLLGLGAFLAVLGYGTRGALRARVSPPPDRRAPAEAVLVALAGTLVAACFLSEQFYLPIWLLVALGLALDPSPSPTPSSSGPGRT